MSWMMVLVITAGSAIAALELWSFSAGCILGSVLGLVGLRVHLWWDKRGWIRRFPELKDGATWKRSYGVEPS